MYSHAMCRFICYSSKEMKSFQQLCTNCKLTYSTATNRLISNFNFVWGHSLAPAARRISSAFAGFIGTPADMVNVRMQNDVKLPLEQRRKYVTYSHILFYCYYLSVFVSRLSIEEGRCTFICFVSLNHCHFHFFRPGPATVRCRTRKHPSTNSARRPKRKANKTFVVGPKQLG